MKRAGTVDEYVALIKEAIYEVEELRAAIEYDEEYMGDAIKFIGELEKSLKDVFESMKDGSYCWRTGDLSYMDIINEVDDRLLPFRALLIRISDTHKNGLEPDTE